MMSKLLLPLFAIGAVATNPTHYGNPTGGCEADEQAVQVQGVSGDFCSPPCKGGSCPADMPKGDTAQPTCALQTTGGAQYCALVCQPGGDANQCGSGTCQSIQGVGICTYAANSTVFAISTTPVHKERLEQIAEIQSTAGVTWRAAAHPRFAQQAPGASKPLCGVKGSWKDAVDAAVQRGQMERFVTDANLDIPDSFDSAKQWPQCAKSIKDVRDQSNCGCCWAFAAAEAASDRMCIASNGSLLMPLSDEDVCFCASDDGCGGGQIDVPWQYIQQNGAVTGGQFKGTGPFGAGYCANFELPHCHHHGPQGKDPYPAEGAPGCPSQSSKQCPTKCDKDAAQEHADFQKDKLSFKGKVLTASGEQGIQQMIMTGGPVETAFTVYSDFENYAGGIYHHVTGEMAGGHAVKFWGWGEENGVKFWEVANSWNPYWGEGGSFRIRRGTNEGGIEDAVVGSDHNAVWGRKNQLESLLVV